MQFISAPGINYCPNRDIFSTAQFTTIILIIYMLNLISLTENYAKCLTRPTSIYHPLNLSWSRPPSLLMRDSLFFSYLNYLNQIRFFGRLGRIGRILTFFDIWRE